MDFQVCLQRTILPARCSLETATDYIHRANNKFYADHTAAPDHPAIYWTDTTLTDQKGREIYRSNRITCGWDESWNYFQTGEYHEFVLKCIDQEIKGSPVGTTEEELDEKIRHYINKNQIGICDIWTLRYMRHCEQRGQVSQMRSTVGKIIYSGHAIEPVLFYIVMHNKGEAHEEKLYAL